MVRPAGPWWAEIDGADCVVNLAGRSVDCRYGAANRRAILESRVAPVRAVGAAIGAASRPPATWLQAGTATIYAHRHDAPNDERDGILGGAEPDAPATWRFSIEVARAWERALADAETPATRKVALRSAMTMSPDRGGVFDALLGLVRRGFGGKCGDGRQYVSWIHEQDFVRALRWILARPELAGPVNVCAPHPLPNAEFMRELRRAWGIRYGLPASRWMLEIGALLLRTETELVLKSRAPSPGACSREPSCSSFRAGARRHVTCAPGGARPEPDRQSSDPAERPPRRPAVPLTRREAPMHRPGSCPPIRRITSPRGARKRVPCPRGGGVMRIRCRVASWGACAVFALLSSAAAAPPAAEVRWRSGARGAPAPMQPLALRQAIVSLSAGTQRRVVVHLDGPVGDRREPLEAAGIRLLAHLGPHSFFAALRPGADAAAAAGVVALEAVDPRNKLHPDLAAGIVHPWSIVRVDEPKGAPPDPVTAVYVLLHRDADLKREAPRVIARHAGEIRSFLETVNGVVAHVAASRVGQLAGEDAVMWVEPPLPPLVGLNDSNRARVGADVLQDPPYDLDGAGVDVLVYDGGQSFAHGDLAGRLTVGASDTSGVIDHATHVSCTVAGSGAGSGGQFRGMAPGASVVSYGFEQEGGLQQGFLYTDPGDLEDDYTEAITVYGADVANNSIGTNTASNGFPCSWEGDYGFTDTIIDEIARGAIGAPFRIVWANGNERFTGACGTTYHTTAPPACAKNHLTVGALNSDDDSVTSFTSWGPCDDGRLKPDVSAPGCQGGGDGGVTSCNSFGGYGVSCGTSMACPTTTGVAALLLQRYRQAFPGEPDFRNSTLRAVLAQTALDLVTPGPDYQTGYGSIRAVPAVDLVAAGRFLESEVAPGQTYGVLVLVGASDTELKVTLAWDDPAGTPVVDPALVNDLDLRVIGPGATVNLPWTLDPGNPTAPAVRTQRDGVNNIEQVVIDAPAPGAYRVEVVGFDVAQGPTQSFSLAASPTLIPCAPAGVISTDAGRISCSADLGIQVVDCDLNTDDGAIETVTVGAASASEPAGESVVLTETEPESAAFAGSLAVATSDAAGVLLVAEGETVSVTYVDADDGAGGSNVPVTAQVVVDCTAPSITSVTLAEVNPRDATAAVVASEPVRLALRYGTACGSLTGSVTKLNLSTTHQVELDDLTDDTTYWFVVEAEDEAGNAAVADNGGSCYTFTTPEIPDFFSEQFTSGVDLAGLSLTFTPNGSPDFYAACVAQHGGSLPTDPAGGTNLNLGDDVPISFLLGGGATVGLYGQSHATLFVSPNGYLTFGSGSSDYDESFADHFALPRVAALYDDLHPGQGGSVSLKQLADRVAVTWLAVPEYNAGNSNTFQIEMFFDGTIRMSWLALAAPDAIVGLSQGAGLDPDFLPNDLSQSGSCGPTPPFVQDLQVQTTIGDPLAIALVGNDDGTPSPLVYRIASLPGFGLLSDPVGAVTILEAPHDLAGSSVVYQPFPGYGGPDGFSYRADDGGLPPDGGESEVGVVTIQVVVGAPEMVAAFLVDDLDPGWSVSGAWAFGPPAGGGSHGGDPTSGATGANVYGYDLAGDYANNLSEEYLTTGAIDLSNVSGATLQFRRWLGIESSLKDHAALRVSADGASWTTVWNHSGPGFSESAWSLQTYDISSVADGEDSVRLRWVMGTTDAAVTYPGWNLDDVRIVGTIVATCSAAPAEVGGLLFTDRQTLQWNAVAPVGGSTPVYDTIRSSAATEFVDGTICVEPDGADTESTDTDEPPPAGIFYYLVRAENDCGMGPLGENRVARLCAP